MAQLKFEITTPEKTVYKADIDQVTVPTPQGEITILPHHVPLVSQLVPGELSVKQGNEVTHMAVSGGFIEVRPGSEVVVLADTAERAEDIDVKRAEEARARAKALMESERKDETKFVDAVTSLEKHLARLRVAERAHHRPKRGFVTTEEGEDM